MTPSFVWARAWAVARKEVFHIRRDPFTLTLALGLPVLMVLVYGFAMDFNVKNVPLSVSDSDRTQASRRLIDLFTSSHYFLVNPSGSMAEAVQDVTAEHAKACLIIPPRFEKDLLAGRGAEAQILLDGADNSTVGPVAGYLNGIQTMASQRIGGFDPPKLYELRTRFLFNPELNSRWFVIPGLTVVVMAILSIMLTALTVAREWENGSMELLLSTPIQPLEIIVGKLAPYAVLGITAQVFVYVIARTVFQVPFVGNLAVFALGCVLCLGTYLAQGILISVIARKPQVAMQFSMLSGMLPTNLLSGFVFPIASMPLVFRYLTMIFPARWFMTISRDTYLKGSSLLELSGAFLMLTLFCGGMILAATRRFKRDLEP
ncbi:MAG: ABC transporter permease [Elusimicrobiota bacterium]|jgi:ABC-2 type transport system permease protein